MPPRCKLGNDNQEVTMSKLYLFFKGYPDTAGGNLWWTVFDGTSWAGEQHIPNVGMSDQPSPVFWNGRIHVFYQGVPRGDHDGQLWFTDYDGQNWQPPQQVQPVGMSFSPSAVVYNNDLYVFHQWAYQNGELWYKVYDGTNWQPDTRIVGPSVDPQGAANAGQIMSCSPSAVVWNERLYVFYQNAYPQVPFGATGNGGLCYKVFDGNEWQPDAYSTGYTVPGVAMSDSPSAIVWNGRIHVFHRWAYEHTELWFTYFDGTNWSPDTQVPGVTNAYVTGSDPGASDRSSASAITFYKSTPTLTPELYVFYNDGNAQLAYAVYDGTNWLPDTAVPALPQDIGNVGCLVL